MLCVASAGEAYGSGDEKRAAILRGLADELDKMSEEGRDKQKAAKKETEKWGEPIDYDE